MHTGKQVASLILILLLAFAYTCNPLSVQAQDSAPGTVKMSADKAREENAYALAVQAYLWGYPAFLRRHGARCAEGRGAYVNDFRKFTDLKTAKDRFVVTPNNVTIDGYGNFDVTNETLVVFVPKVTGADFAGDIPGDMIQVKSRTRQGVLGLRVFVNGTADLPKARVAQSGFQAMPLSAYLRYGLAYKRPAERVVSRPIKGALRRAYATSMNSATGCTSSYRSQRIPTTQLSPPFIRSA